MFKMHGGNVRTKLNGLGVCELPHGVDLGLLGCDCMHELFDGLLSIEHWAIKLRAMFRRKLLWRHGSFCYLWDMCRGQILCSFGNRVFKLSHGLLSTDDSPIILFEL